MARCQTLSQPRFFFYMPTLTDDTEKRLTISGTVYASNLTPLPDALVEVWRADPKYMNHPYSPILFAGRLHTDEAGHYEFTTMKPTPSEQTYLHYRVTYQYYCPLLVHLHLVAEPVPRPTKRVFAQVEVTGPILHGPVDIVLPVPPPEP